MSIFVPVFLGLLIIMFLVGICLSAQTWRWHQMTLMVSVFFGVLFMVFVSSMTLKTHQSWRSLLRTRTGEIEKEVDDKVRLLAEAKNLRVDLGDLVEERGRIYPNCTPGNVNAAAGTVEVSFKFPAPSAPGPAEEDADAQQPDPADAQPQAAPPKPDIKLSVYVFQQTNDENSDSVEIGKYLGAYLVTDFDFDPQSLMITFKLKAPSIKSPFMSENIKTEGPWVLYERMPLDTHELYVNVRKRKDPKEIEKLDSPKTLEELEEEGLLLSEDLFQNPTDYKKYVARYLNHNKKLSEISDEDKALLDLKSSNRVWVMCNIDKNYQFHIYSRTELESIIKSKMYEFKAANEPSLSDELLPPFLNLVDGKVLTAEELKADPNFIELTKTVSEQNIQNIYKKILKIVTVNRVIGDSVRMEIASAKDLESKEVLSIESGSEYYNRPLTGYDASFAAMYFKHGQVVEQTRETDDQKEFYKALNAIINNPTPTAEKPSLVEVAKERKKQLEADLAKHTQDFTHAEKLNGDLQAKLAEVLRGRKKAFKKNILLERELTKRHAIVQEAVQERLNKQKKSTSKPKKLSNVKLISSGK